MLIWDLVKSCLLAKRIGTATFLCIPIVNQFLNNSFVKRIGTAALLHFIPIFYHNIHFKACTCGNTRQAGACYFRVTVSLVPANWGRLCLRTILDLKNMCILQLKTGVPAYQQERVR